MVSTLKPRGHRTRFGLSIPAAARELDVAESTMRRAVANGEIETITFGGTRRIPPREIDRIRRALIAAD